MKLKVRLGCVRSTDVELGQGRSRDLIDFVTLRDIIRLIRDGEKGGRGDGGGGQEGDYIPIATLSPPPQ